MPLDAALNARIESFGRSIFAAIGGQSPSTFSKTFWLSKVLRWSMQRADFKTNLFRLVDVLPTLKTNEAICTHVAEYLAGPTRSISRLLGWGANPAPRSIRGTLTAYAVRRGVREIASLFIAGETPELALPSLRRIRHEGLCYTIDLLGEFCVSEHEAEEYLQRYLNAIEVLSRHAPQWPESRPLISNHPADAHPVCISVKLSALYSQCSAPNFKRSVEVLSDRLAEIARAAHRGRASLFVDAEDSGNNPIIYETFVRVFAQSEFATFPYPGIVVQAYAKDAESTLLRLFEFARSRGAPIAVRLVKGAYWDFEYVQSCQSGIPFPLYSRKENSDARFEYLTRLLLQHTNECLPAIASHNIRSLSHACIFAESLGLAHTQYELEMLYGMAEPIARAFAQKERLVRLYVPLGNLFVGMGYLVRRLLENTSNESFLRHTFFDAKAIAELLREPLFQEEESCHVS